jgi:hypothetical protein
MPGFVKSKYSKEFNSELRVRALGVLSDAERALTIQEICGSDLTLVNQTPQKMARILNELVEAGFATKGKRDNKVTYRTIGDRCDPKEEEK